MHLPPHLNEAPFWRQSSSAYVDDGRPHELSYQRLCMRISGYTAASLLRLFVLFVATFAGAHVWAQPATAGARNTVPGDATPSYITVRINDQNKSDSALVLRAGPQGAAFFLSAKDAASFRLVLERHTNAVTFDDVSYFPLQGFAGLSIAFNESTQTLSITASPEMFRGEVIALGAKPRSPLAKPGFGSFLSYDVFTQRTSQGSASASVGGQFEWGIFTPSGVLTNSFLGSRTSTTKQLLRLETAFTMDQPEARASWRIGDGVSRGAGWGNSALFAGLQYATNFSTQPSLVTYPLNSVSGEAALPSVVDVYVNNLLSVTQRVQQGPFTLNDLPNVNGTGTIRLVVRDLLGREQSILVPLYGSNQLLRQGLNDFAFQVGTLRERIGTKSADYGRGFASGIFRTGVNDKFTFESAFEFARGRYAGGLGATWLMGFVGEFSASAATSFQAADTVQSAVAPIVTTIENLGSIATSGLANRSGQSFSGSWDWRSKDLSVGVQTRFSSAGFRTIFSLTDAARPLREISTFAGFGSALGSFGLGYVNVVRPSRATNEFLQLSWSRSLRRWGQLSLNVITGFRATNARSYSLNYVVPFGPVSTFGMSESIIENDLGRRSELRTNFQRSLPSGDGFGYRLDVSDRRTAILAAQTQRSVGLYSLDVSHLNSITTSRVGASGAVVFMGGELVLGRRVEDAFGLVSVPGFANVRVTLNNQSVGRTNAKGNLFVARLRPYEVNALAIDQEDIPVGAEIVALKLDATPYLKSGVLVRFEVKQSQSATLKLVDEAGLAIPAGAMLTLLPSGESLPVGEGGEVYLTGLSASNRARVSLSGKNCTIEIAFKASNDPQPFLGEIKCKLEK